MHKAEHPKRNITVLKWFHFLRSFNPFSVVSIIYFSQLTGSYALGFSISSISMIASSFFEIPTGVFSDFLGRHKTIMLGAVGRIVSMLFYAIGGSYLMFAIGSIIDGLAESFYSGNNDALFYESLDDPENHYAEVAGKISFIAKIGAGTAALLGGYLAFKLPTLIVWISIIPQIFCLFTTFAIVEPRVHKKVFDTNILSHLKEAIRNFTKNRKLRILSLTSAFEFGIEETLYEFGPAFVVLFWPAWALGIVRSVMNFIVAANYWFAGKMIKRWTAVKTYIFGNLSNRFFAILATALPSVISPALLVCSELFYGVTKVAESDLMQKEFTNHQRATMGSLISLLSGFIFAIFSFSFGLFADNIGPAKAMLIGNTLLVIIILIYWRSFREEAKRSLNV